MSSRSKIIKFCKEKGLEITYLRYNPRGSQELFESQNFIGNWFLYVKDNSSPTGEVSFMSNYGCWTMEEALLEMFEEIEEYIKERAGEA